MLNLKKSKRARNRTPNLPDQGFLNEVYLWEKFDIGHEYNIVAGIVMNLGVHNLMHNATIFHFVGKYKPKRCPVDQPWLAVCNKWNHYNNKLLNLTHYNNKLLNLTDEA